MTSRIMTIITILGLGAALPGMTHAHDYRIGDIVIDHPVALETPRTAMAGAGYMTLTNTGTEPDRLLAVRAEFPEVMIHTTEEADGVARMIHLNDVTIPAGETVTFEPGGMHVMFMGLGGSPLVAGETIPATLVFEIAGEIDVVFDIEARGAAAGGHDHASGHDHDHGPAPEAHDH